MSRNSNIEKFIQSFDLKYRKLKESILLTNEWKKNINNQVMIDYDDCLESFQDLVGDGFDEPSNLFYLLNRHLLYLLDNDPDISVRKKDIEFTRKFHKILAKYGHLALKCTQKIENRNYINNPSDKDIIPDNGIILPEKSVIYVANHGFRDDLLASVLAAPRHTWIFLGSLPETYNTTNGLAMYLVGIIMLNRKTKESKKASISKAETLLASGTDLLILPEGGWNKSMSEVVLPLWKGFYEISKEGNYPIVPIVHYNKHPESLAKENVIHTIVDDPIDVSSMSQKEALETVRDVLASWRYKMMEVYGKSTRKEEMKGFDSPEDKWQSELELRMKSVGRYDSEIETMADYRDRTIVRPETVFESTANITDITLENMNVVDYAKKLVKERKEEDFQRRY